MALACVPLLSDLSGQFAPRPDAAAAAAACVPVQCRSIGIGRCRACSALQVAGAMLGGEAAAVAAAVSGAAAAVSGADHAAVTVIGAATSIGAGEDAAIHCASLHALLPSQPIGRTKSVVGGLMRRDRERDSDKQRKGRDSELPATQEFKPVKYVDRFGLYDHGANM